jgi:hypothetical protein
MDSQCACGHTFSRWRMVQIEQIVVGQVFSLWRMVQVDSLLTYHGLVFFLKAQIVAPRPIFSKAYRLRRIYMVHMT